MRMYLIPFSLLIVVRIFLTTIFRVLMKMFSPVRTKTEARTDLFSWLSLLSITKLSPLISMTIHIWIMKTFQQTFLWSKNERERMFCIFLMQKMIKVLEFFVTVFWATGTRWLWTLGICWRYGGCVGRGGSWWGLLQFGRLRRGQKGDTHRSSDRVHTHNAAGLCVARQFTQCSR